MPNKKPILGLYPIAGSTVTVEVFLVVSFLGLEFRTPFITSIKSFSLEESIGLFAGFSSCAFTNKVSSNNIKTSSPLIFK